MRSSTAAMHLGNNQSRDRHYALRQDRLDKESAMGLLAGKVAIVNGAGGGLGRAYALMMSLEGAKSVVNDYGVPSAGGDPVSESANEVVREIVAAGGEEVAQDAAVGTIAGGSCAFDNAL